MRRLITSHIGTHPVTQKLMIDGRIDVELVPRDHARRAHPRWGLRLGGVLNPTGVGTLVAEGKQVLEVGRKRSVVESALKADFTPINARRAGYFGKLDRRSRRATSTGSWHWLAPPPWWKLKNRLARKHCAAAEVQPVSS
jgi:acyl CoA:acetate/3-ketoacid CoA transferase alpha subunit